MHSTRRCSVDGCERAGVKLVRGMCNTHYVRERRAGRLDPDYRAKRNSKRFWGRVEKSAGCWLWGGYLDADGYGHFHVHNTQVMAHRFAYEDAVGPIPPGLTIDHVRARGCSSRACVNPAHLEPVTIRENTVRGNSPRLSAQRQLDKSHCPRGHEYAGANLYVEPSGKRRCRTCVALNQRASYARRRAERK